MSKEFHPLRSDEVCAPATAGGWQPIATAPKDGPILAHRMGVWSVPMILIWLDGPGLGTPAWRQFDGEPQRSFQPTHWMPLPSPPVCAPSVNIKERARND